MENNLKKLIAYNIHGTDLNFRAAPAARQWMDETPQSYAYRCLPLNIANMHGWEVLCPVDFDAVWDGGVGMDAVHIQTDGPSHLKPISHFGSGILTFHVGALFQTPPGHNLFVTGPLNTPRDGIYGLSGIIETDWSPYTFTMNWKFTAPDKRISFSKGDPICCFFPVQRGYLESFEPEILPLDTNPELKVENEKWASGRSDFNAELRQEGSEAQQEKWQKNYYRGMMPGGGDGPPDHQIKLRIKEFKTSK